jgi:gamma-glutamylcyclotransferase (GGCT)/AIG2-like uncharacterized protein YtfP
VTPDSFYLFTYGTLRKAGRATAPLLVGCERAGEGLVTGTLYHLGEYPALLLAGADRIRGDLWRCPTHKLRDLDRYEGARHGLFRRAAVRVNGVPAWVYVAGPRLGPRLTPEARIESGVWRA